MKQKLLTLLLLSGMAAPALAQQVIFKHAEARGVAYSVETPYTRFSDLSPAVLPWNQNGSTTEQDQQIIGNTQNTLVRKSYLDYKNSDALEEFEWFSLQFKTPSYTKMVYKPEYFVFLRHWRLWRGMRIAFFDYGTDADGYWKGRSSNPKGGNVFYTASKCIQDANVPIVGGNGATSETVTTWHHDVLAGEYTAFFHYGDDNPDGREIRTTTEKMPELTVDNSNSANPDLTTRYGAFSLSKSTGDQGTGSSHVNYINVRLMCPCDTFYYKYVTFDANGGTGTMAQQTVENKANLSANVFKKAGHTFIGWKDGNGNSYADQAEITAIESSKGPVTLTAQWEPYNHAITYDKDDVKIGSVLDLDGETTDVYYTVTMTFPKPDGAKYACSKGFQVMNVASVPFLLPFQLGQSGKVALEDGDNVTLVFKDQNRAWTDDAEYESNNIRSGGAFVGKAEITFLDENQVVIENVKATFNNNIVLPRVNNPFELVNGNFAVVGDLAEGATNRYAVGEPWVSNVAFKNMGIRVMASAASTEGGNVLVWRGSGNNNYISQPICVKPGNICKLTISQIAAGNANADFNVGIGTEAGLIDVVSDVVRLGTNNDSVKTLYLAVPENLDRKSFFFTFSNTVKNTASSGNDPVSQIDYIKLVSISPVDYAKEMALANLPTADESIFTYNPDDLEAIKAAIEAAITVEGVEAAVAAIDDLEIPALSGEWGVKNVNAGSFLGTTENVNVALVDLPLAVNFEQAADGRFYVKYGEKYINMKGNNNWSMSADDEAKTAWTFELNEGKYTIKGDKGMIGTDAIALGSFCYGNKSAANNGTWTIALLPSLPETKASLIAGLPLADASLFTYNVDEIAAIQEAIEAATSREQLQTIMADLAELTIPALTMEWRLNIEGVKLYANIQDDALTIEEKPQPVYFKRTEDGKFKIDVDLHYLGGDGITLLSQATAWDVVYDEVEDRYIFVGDNGMLGASDLVAGASFALNCSNADYVKWAVVPFYQLEIAMTVNGYGTYCAPFETEIPEGLKAYVVMDIDLNGYTLMMSELDKVIPAHTPVLLEGEAELNVEGVERKGTPEVGLLVGVYQDTPARVGECVLQNHDGLIGFYRVLEENIVTIPAFHAFLIPEAPEVKVFTFGNADGIQALESMTAGKAEIFDLNGRKQSKLQKGINIVNGVKVLVK